MFMKKNKDKLLRYEVKTDMATLFRLRVLLKRIGMEKLLVSGKLDKSDIMGSIVASIEDESLLYEFCRIVTGLNEHDFSTERFGTVCRIIDDFFVDLWSQMPESWCGQIRASVKAAGKYLVEIGRAMIVNRDGGTIQPIGATE